MGLNVTVCVATYGGSEWIKTAERAITSAEPQAPVVHQHSLTLAAARNLALAQVTTEWVVFLDADDELEPGYIEALAGGTADLRAPSVRYVRGSKAHRPYVPQVAGHRHACVAECLQQGNWLVIGTAVSRKLATAVGGFREWPLYEDWDFFLRCYLAGATVEAIPKAVYRAHVRSDSRNRAPSRALKERTHWEIHRANLPREAAA